MSYVIDKAVPVAELSTGRQPTAERAAMIALEVGDSFLITDPDRVKVARWATRALRPKVFTIREIPGQGWRVWRRV